MTGLEHALLDLMSLPLIDGDFHLIERANGEGNVRAYAYVVLTPEGSRLVLA